MCDEKRVYRPLDILSNQDIKRILESNDVNEIIFLPLSVGEYHSNWKFAQEICVILSEHSNPIVRSNALLGFSYIARTKGKLEKHIVKPILLKALKDTELFNGRATDGSAAAYGRNNTRWGRQRAADCA